VRGRRRGRARCVVTCPWGNGTTYSRTFDLDGRITRYPLGHPAQSGLVRTVTWDAASRVTGYTHVNGSNVAQPAFNQTFGYDDLNRLSSWTASSTSQAYQYDLTGNRTRLTIGATAHAYTVASTSNRLAGTAGPAPAQTNTYDAAGNLTANGQATFTYSDRGRMSRATIGTNQVNYLYNGLGQRVSKQGPASLVPTGTHLYTYDEGGRLIGEYDFTTTPRVRQETVYLGDTPVAVLTQTVSGSPAVFTTVVNYVYADHIDTPRVITQASDNRMRWRWDQADPFGTSAPNQNPASIGAFTYNPRFPGQFYDVESNLHYNYFRDYDPRIGRYVQSDPIGLAGGINTYAYVGGLPTSSYDPLGLANSSAVPRLGSTTPRPPDFVTFTWSGPIASISIAVSSSGKVFLAPGTGRASRSAGCTVGIFVLENIEGNETREQRAVRVNAFLREEGGGIDYGALGFGLAQQFGSNQVATGLIFGVGLPGGNAGYSILLGK
jgi:RHS repeat-associated protein